MNQDDVWKLAASSGFILRNWSTGWAIYAPLGNGGLDMTNELTSFAERVAQHVREQINKPALPAELREELLEALNAAMRSGRKAGWWDSNESTMDKIQAAITKLTNLGESK